jgi:cardiolipin synthase
MNYSESGPSEFTRNLIDELSRKGYRLEAWRKFMSDSWTRSLDDIRASPSLTRSFLVWAGAFSVAGVSLVFLSWRFHPDPVTMSSLVFWLPWYALSVVFVLTHLGMADTEDGLKEIRFSAPNQLSFMRLALAPLVLLPCLTTPVHPLTGPVFIVFITAMSVSDALDGWVARRRGISTRLGQMLDYLADLAFLTFLTIGLYLAAAIPGSLLWLLIVRYPLTLIGALILYFTRGPAPLNPTFIGRATTLVTSIVLLLIAFRFLLSADWPSSIWIDWFVRSLHLLVGVNIIYLVYLGFTWGRNERATS